MYDEELGDIDNDDFLDEQPKAKQTFQPASKNRSKQPSYQNDNELEFFDEDLDDDNEYLNQKQKPVALPRLQNKQEVTQKHSEPPKKTAQKDTKLDKIKQKETDNFWEEDEPQENEFNYEYDEDESRITKTERNQPVQKTQKQEYDEAQEEPEQNQEEEYYDYEYESDKEKNNKNQPNTQSKQNIQGKEKKLTQEEDNYEDEYDEYFEDNQQQEQEQVDQEEEEEGYDDYQEQDQTYDQNISQNDYSIQKTRISHQSKVRKPPIRKPEKKPTYGNQAIQYFQYNQAEKYAKIIEDKDYSNWNDKQLIQENNLLRSMLKQLSQEVTSLIEKAKPQKQTKKGASLENKVKLLREELKNNQKKLEQQQAEIKKIRNRISQVSSPKYLNELTEEIKKNQKLIEDKRKKNKLDQLEQNKKAKNLDKIENIVGNPDILVEKQKKAKELDEIERRNTTLQEQINKLRSDIEENQRKLPKVSQLLQEKIDQAVKLKIDVDPDQPLTKLREKYADLDRKKIRLIEHLELLRSKEGKVQVAEREIIELKRQIKSKDNDINIIEMQVMEQRKQVDDVKNKIPERFCINFLKYDQSKFKFMQPLAAQTQQNYNQQDLQKQEDEELQKNQRKLTSAKPVLQTKPPIIIKTDKKKQDSSPQPERKQNIPQLKEEPIVEQFAEESVTQLETIEDKSQTNETKPIPVVSNQPVKPLNKPFSFKKNVKSTEPEPKQQYEENALTFGKQNENEFLIVKNDNSKKTDAPKKEENKENNQKVMEKKVEIPKKHEEIEVVLNKNTSDDNKKTASFLNEQTENKKQEQSTNEYQMTLGQPPDETNKEVPRRMMRMMKKPDNMGQNNSNMSNEVNSSQNVSQQLSIVSNPQPPEDNSFQVNSRRNRMLKNNDTDNLAGGYDFSKRNEPQEVPKNNELAMEKQVEYQFGGNEGRRNRNINNPPQKSLLNEEEQKKEFTLNRNPTNEINKPQNSFNKEPQKEVTTFNLNKKKEEPAYQLTQQVNNSLEFSFKQVNKPQKRQRDGPKKLDLWGDDDNVANTDFNNIKSLDQDQPKIQPKVQEKPQDYEREMTLEEILGGAVRKEEKKPLVVELDPDPKKRNKIGIQQVNQAEKQRQLATKAENQDFFGDLDI